MERHLTPAERTSIQRLYEERHSRMGRHIKTVGWSSKDDQTLRFEMLFRGIDPRGKRILDVGCGLGDMIPFLDQLTGGDYDYLGTDLSPALAADARSTFSGERRQFLAGDIVEMEELAPVDLVVMSGALNFRIEDNVAYAKTLMRKMFSLARETASMNFLTSHVDFQDPKNFHHSPSALFEFAKSLTRWVTLYHDYPLWEFTLQLFRRAQKGRSGI
jgi:SAM-dependent methyltransferase